MKCLKNYTTLINYTSNKSILILGNAESLFSKNRMNIITKYDIIIRLNRGVDLNKKQISLTSNRCNIHCSSVLNFLGNCLEKPNFSIWMTNKFRNTVPKHFLFYPKEWWRELEGGGYRPTTGYMVIDLFSRIHNSSIGILGFDFWDSKTFYNPKIWTPDHYSPKEKEKILEIIHRNKYTLYE